MRIHAISRKSINLEFDVFVVIEGRCIFSFHLLDLERPNHR